MRITAKNVNEVGRQVNATKPTTFKELINTIGNTPIWSASKYGSGSEFTNDMKLIVGYGFYSSTGRKYSFRLDTPIQSTL